MLSTKCVEESYLIYMYKKDLALNNLQWLIGYKTKSKNNLNERIEEFILWSKQLKFVGN